MTQPLRETKDGKSNMVFYSSEFSKGDELINGGTLKKGARFWYLGILHYGKVVSEPRREIWSWTN